MGHVIFNENPRVHTFVVLSSPLFGQYGCKIFYLSMEISGDPVFLLDVKHLYISISRDKNSSLICKFNILSS